MDLNSPVAGVPLIYWAGLALGIVALLVALLIVLPAMKRRSVTRAARQMDPADGFAALIVAKRGKSDVNSDENQIMSGTVALFMLKDGPVAISTIAEKLKLTPTQLRDAIDSLLHNGMVEVRRDAGGDKLALTELGQKLSRG